MIARPSRFALFVTASNVSIQPLENLEASNRANARESYIICSFPNLFGIMVLYATYRT
jgi:hypothetical protein